MKPQTRKVNFFSQEEMNRGWKYLAVGLFTFLLDLTLLYFFVEFLSVREFLAAGISFGLMTTLNYLLNRRFAFSGTDTELKKGYIFFIFFAVLGVITTSGLMFLSVDLWGFGYLIPRIIIAVFVSISTYFLNYFFTFNLNRV